MHAALEEYGDLPLLLTVLSGPPGAAGQSCNIQPASFGATVLMDGPVWTGQLVAMKPTIGCSAATNAAKLKGAIALIQRGTCYFSTKALYAQNAGAIAAIIYDNVMEEDLITMSGSTDAGSVKIPAIFISKPNGRALVSFLEAAPVSISFPTGEEPPIPGQGTETMNRLENFSSRGPTLDQRLKPDVVCPGGNVQSALSFGDPPSLFGTTPQCGAGAVLEMSGTSMATPNCAGASALVRQYFREGYHVAGVRNLSAALYPSAALIKAVMIQSGRRLYVPMDSGGFVLPETMPDRSQGFGRVELLSVLRFAAGGGGFNLSVWDRENIADGFGVQKCIAVPAGAGALRVTVVWADPPPHLASLRMLVNDLDLSVEGPDGEFLYGNALTQWDNAHGIQPARDTVNNVEQVADF